MFAGFAIRLRHVWLLLSITFVDKARKLLRGHRDVG